MSEFVLSPLGKNRDLVYVCENSVLRRVLGLKREAIPELRTEDLCSSYSLLRIIGVMKSVWIKWAVHKVLIFILIYLLTAIRLTPSGSSAVHIYTNNT